MPAARSSVIQLRGHANNTNNNSSNNNSGNNNKGLEWMEGSRLL